MSDEEQEQQPAGVTEEKLEQADDEPLPDREATSVITPRVAPPGFTRPVQPDE
jgi:hypothetical protein